MEDQTENQSYISRLQILPSSKQEIEHWWLMPEAEPDIICEYGVVVQQTSVAGMELIEIEFLPGAT